MNQDAEDTRTENYSISLLQPMRPSPILFFSGGNPIQCKMYVVCICSRAVARVSVCVCVCAREREREKRTTG